jgi:hypothetical protein
MRLSSFFIGVLFFFCFISKSSFAAGSQYVEIKKPYACVYEYLDPKSKIILQASKNDHFELVYEGTSWYQIKVKDKVGWIEKNAGAVVNKPVATIFSIPLGTFFFSFLLLLAAISGVSILVYRQKTAEI